MKLDEMLGLPKSGVVILRTEKEAFVSYTTSMGADLEDIYNLFRGRAGITMSVVSAGADIETLKLHTEYYRKFYHATLGLSHLTLYCRKVIEYKIRVVPSDDFKYVNVELVSARGDGRVVGRFKNAKLAKEFIETCYGKDNLFRFPVYAANTDTKVFLQEQQKKMLDIR